jgi:hypothetical protein
LHQIIFRFIHTKQGGSGIKQLFFLQYFSYLTSETIILSGLPRVAGQEPPEKLAPVVRARLYEYNIVGYALLTYINSYLCSVAVHLHKAHWVQKKHSFPVCLFTLETILMNTTCLFAGTSRKVGASWCLYYEYS